MENTNEERTIRDIIDDIINCDNDLETIKKIVNISLSNLNI